MKLVYWRALMLFPLLLLWGVSQVFAQGQPDTTVAWGIEWHSMKEAQQLAAEDGKKIFLYSYAEWCGYCKKMESEVYPLESIQKAIEKYFHPVKVDIDSEAQITFNGSTMSGREFARRNRVTATPTAFFIDFEGEVLGIQPGYIPADIFELLLSFVGSDAYRNYKFKEYMDEARKKDQ